MDIVDRFQSHADECRRSARFARDRESKLAWTKLADRWMSLAASEKARRQQLSAVRAQRGRRETHFWAA
jgi:hypothetical protein